MLKIHKVCHRLEGQVSVSKTPTNNNWFSNLLPAIQSAFNSTAQNVANVFNDPNSGINKAGNEFNALDKNFREGYQYAQDPLNTQITPGPAPLGGIPAAAGLGVGMLPSPATLANPHMFNGLPAIGDVKSQAAENIKPI